MEDRTNYFNNDCKWSGITQGSHTGYGWGYPWIQTGRSNSEMVQTNGGSGVVNYFKDNANWTIVNQASGSSINDGITLNEINTVYSPQTSNVLFFDNSDNNLLYSNSFMNDLVSQTSTLKILSQYQIKLQKIMLCIECMVLNN